MLNTLELGKKKKGRPAIGSRCSIKEPKRGNTRGPSSTRKMPEKESKKTSKGRQKHHIRKHSSPREEIGKGITYQQIKKGTLSDFVIPVTLMRRKGGRKYRNLEARYFNTTKTSGGEGYGNEGHILHVGMVGVF